MMGGENSMVRWVKHSPPLASSDYIHFTTRGAEHVGMAFARAFEVCYNFYKLRQELDPEMVSVYMNSEDPSVVPFFSLSGTKFDLFSTGEEE